MNIRVPFKEAWSGEADCNNARCANPCCSPACANPISRRSTTRSTSSRCSPVRHCTGPAMPVTACSPIRSGVIKLVQYLPDGAQRIVRLVNTADVTGLESLLGKPYEHDAIVMQPTEVCCLPASTVQALSKENPDLHVELLKRWHRALSEADAWLTELSTGPARQRIARLLLRLVHDDANPECILFGREDLGAMLGITTETASRTIAEFKRQRLLTELGSHRYRVDTGACGNCWQTERRRRRAMRPQRGGSICPPSEPLTRNQPAML